MSYPVIPSVEMRAILYELAAGCSSNPGVSSSSSSALLSNRLCHLTLRLFANNVDPGNLTLWSDLVESSFPGYVPYFPITWSLPYTDILGVSQLFGGCHLFASTGPGPSEAGVGWALTREDGGTRLVAAQRFTSPTVFVNGGEIAIAEVHLALIYPPP